MNVLRETQIGPWTIREIEYESEQEMFVACSVNGRFQDRSFDLVCQDVRNHEAATAKADSEVERLNQMLRSWPNRATQAERGHWRAQRFDSLGRVVLGTGLTEEQAQRDADDKLAKVEQYLATPPKQRLRRILENKYLSSEDTREAIRAIAEIIL